MRFYEDYACGCLSRNMAKRDLPGYCPKHGGAKCGVFSSDGTPADEETRERVRVFTFFAERGKPA